MTLAPRSAKRLAKANPIFPVLLFPKYLTESIGSSVGPAVTTTLLPDKGMLLKKNASTKSAITSGSSIRPLPSKPLASAPEVGSMILIPLSESVFKFSCVAAFVNISRSIAGATATGHLELRKTACSKLVQAPCAKKDNVCAVHGATRKRSPHSPNSTWFVHAPDSMLSVKSECTGFPTKVARVRGVIKPVALGVITTLTSAPLFTNSLARNADL